ncbi:hypothetical protein ACQP3L_37680, partial [Escherichia coli]
YHNSISDSDHWLTRPLRLTQRKPYPFKEKQGDTFCSFTADLFSLNKSCGNWQVRAKTQDSLFKIFKGGSF